MTEEANNQLIDGQKIPLKVDGSRNVYSISERTISATSESEISKLILASIGLKIPLSEDECELFKDPELKSALKEEDVFFAVIESGGQDYLCANREFVEWIRKQGFSQLLPYVDRLDSLRSPTMWWGVDSRGEFDSTDDSLRSVGISLLKQAIDLPQEMTVERNEIHEQAHVVDVSMADYGAAEELFSMLATVHETIKDENIKVELEKLLQSQVGLMEAFAFSHEIFGRNISASQIQFEPALLAERLATLLSDFTSGVGFRPRIESFIEDSIDQSQIMEKDDEHRLGTLVLIFGSAIVSESGEIKLANLVEPENDKENEKRAITLAIVNRITEIAKDPQRFSQEYINLNRYDEIIQQLRNNRRQAFNFLEEHQLIDKVMVSNNKLLQLRRVFSGRESN